MTAPTLGKYQLIRRLATGGMAELFLARASGVHGFEKLVVLKRILPQHAESEDFIRMFLTEARLAATLHHPNIVQVYDIGEEGGAHFFTMEYVTGQDLRKLVRAARRKQKPIPLEHILHIIMGVASGLNHAHDKAGMDGRPLGIVHRDVSPSNVLVTYEGDVKIVDFGIAKAATAQVATIAGTLKGKIPYMSPEQCRGESVDRRSDIFSIGTLLWELTTGKRLFAGDNEFAILNRVAKGDVPLPSSIRPDYPPELEAIVMRALQPEPDHRYTTAQDLQIDLEDFSREARLPVSSARMGKFMRELFEEEIQATVEEVSREQAPQPTSGPEMQAVSPQTPVAGVPAVPGGPLGPAPQRDGMEGHEYTPSELRQHSAPTGGGYSGDATNSGTDIALDVVPGKMRTGPLIAIGGGFLAAVAIAGGIAWAMANQEKAADGTEQKVEIIKSDAPTPEDDGEPEAKPAKPYSFGPASSDPATEEPDPAANDTAQPSSDTALDPGTPPPDPVPDAPADPADSSGAAGDGDTNKDEPPKSVPKRPIRRPKKPTKKDEPKKKKDINSAVPW